MFSFSVRLQSVDDVKAFVAAASLAGCDIDVLAGRYLVDAKSIMGIFGLDLSQPITVRVHGNDHAADSFRQAVSHLAVS